MGRNKLWYLVSYDVRDTKRLRKTAKHIEGYGERIQYSLFRCSLSKRQMERLRWELKKIMTQEDDLLIIGICDACVKKICQARNQREWPSEIEGFKII